MGFIFSMQNITSHIFAFDFEVKYNPGILMRFIYEEFLQQRSIPHLSEATGSGFCSCSSLYEVIGFEGRETLLMPSASTPSSFISQVFLFLTINFLNKRPTGIDQCVAVVFPPSLSKSVPP